MIGIINYGAGNLRSVKKAFDFLGVKAGIISVPKEMDRIDRLVLPGVGFFGYAMDQIRKSRFDRVVTDWIKQDKPFLGICVGLQMLLESSEESPETRGLSLISGTNRRFDAPKVPQMGWNRIQYRQESRLFEGIPDNSFFYFIHSFYADPSEGNVTLSETEYGVTYTSTVQTGNAFAVQFHPEKSGKTGLKLLKNWVEQC